MRKKDKFNKRNEDRVASIQAFDFNEELVQYTTEMRQIITKRFDELGENISDNYINSFMAGLTWEFLSGSLRSKQRNVLPPYDLMHPVLIREYMKSYDMWFYKRNEDGTWHLSNIVYDGNKSGQFASINNPSETPGESCIK